MSETNTRSGETRRTALVTGVANTYSIAWGCAKALSEEGYDLCLTYPDDRMKQNVEELAATLPRAFTLPLNATNDADFIAVRDILDARWPQGCHGVIHSIAYADRKSLGGAFSATSREDFRVSLDISCFSFIALTGALMPLLKKARGCALTMTYLGGERVVPNYNLMGVAKAALEMSTKYLANEAGRDGVRVNALSPGPIKTMAARGISGFAEMHRLFVERSPLGRAISVEEVGHVAAFLCSEKGAAITGQILFVDGGCEILAF